MINEGKELIVALDVGSTRILAMVAEIDQNNAMEVIGWDRRESRGIREGVINDIDAVANCIRQTIEMVQRQADCEIKEVWTTISGSHIECKQSHGLVSVKDNEVTQSDIDRVIELARTVQMPPGKEILHTLTQEYILDNERGIRTPLGMSGMRLEAKVHFITGSLNATQNLLRCIRRCGLDVVDLYFQPLASAESVLSSDEMNLGVCLIDLGGGTTDFVMYQNGSVIHSGVIPLAGSAITNDIAVAFRTSLIEAEDIKRRFGKALAIEQDAAVEFEITSHSEKNNRLENVYHLASIIQPRVSEILHKVHADLMEAKVGDNFTGVVITGGSSLLYGLEDLAEHIFNKPTRVGVPLVEGKLADMVKNPNCSAAYGLLKLAQKHQVLTEDHRDVGQGFNTIIKKIRAFFNYF
jgi:cell division protein FtsA